jgi:hypothetical protein
VSLAAVQAQNCPQEQQQLTTQEQDQQVRQFVDQAGTGALRHAELRQQERQEAVQQQQMLQDEGQGEDELAADFGSSSPSLLSILSSPLRPPAVRPPQLAVRLPPPAVRPAATMQGLFSQTAWRPPQSVPVRVGAPRPSAALPTPPGFPVPSSPPPPSRTRVQARRTAPTSAGAASARAASAGGRGSQEIAPRDSDLPIVKLPY